MYRNPTISNAEHRLWLHNPKEPLTPKHFLHNNILGFLDVQVIFTPIISALLILL